MDPPRGHRGLCASSATLCVLPGESFSSRGRVAARRPFVNYNLSDGWYLSSAPIISGNFSAGSGDHWTVPVGAGVGKLFKVGKLPINTQLVPYYNAATPDFGPDWQLRLQIQFLFPS